MAPANTSSGGFQGSLLESTFFLAFISDLVKSMYNPSYLFAGDVKVADVDLEEDVEGVKP